MKVAHIDHSRCGEPSGITYVVVPSEMTEEEFKTAVYGAAESYKEQLDTPLKAGPQYVPFPGLAQLEVMKPSTTVGEVIEQHKARLDEKRAADDQLERGRRSFGWYLEQQGIRLVQRAEPGLEVAVDWGHRHGVKIRYDGIEFNDSWYWDDEPNPLCEGEDDGYRD